jgi:hypothetical protein
LENQMIYVLEERKPKGKRKDDVDGGHKMNKNA